MNQKSVNRQLTLLRRRVLFGIGGFLPPALAKWSTMMTAAIGSGILIGFGGSAVGAIVGLVLVAAVWLSETIGAVTSTPQTLSKHSTVSLAYLFFMCLAFGELFTYRSDARLPVEWVSLGVLSIAGWLVNALPLMLNVNPLVTANFPRNSIAEMPARRTFVVLARILWAGVGAVGVFAAVGLPSWITACVALIVVVSAAWHFGRAWHYADTARFRTLRQLKKLGPKFVIPYGGVLTYQAEMWYPYLDKLGMPYYIISTTVDTLHRLAKTSDRPIVVPGEETLAEARAIIPDSVRAGYYPHNASKNALFMADERVKSIFVHHGVGDKAPSFARRSANYDFLFVAGQGAIDRYAAHDITIPEEKFRIIGRPQTESISVDDTPIAAKNDVTVLYAPTWQGKNKNEDYSSLPCFGLSIVQRLVSHGAAVIFRPHPASSGSAAHRQAMDEIREVLETDANKNGRAHVWGEKATRGWTVAHVSNHADAMVSDVSGIVTDFMQTGKPFAMVSTRMSAADFRMEFPTSRGSYVIDASHGAVDTAIADMLGPDPLADVRWERREYYLGGFSGDEPVDKFLEESRKIIYRDE